MDAKVPNEKTLWSFREVLVNGKVITKLFNLFRLQLEKKGFAAKTGSMVDACIVEAPRQRNTREENQQIKAGQQPETWKNKSVHVLRQKDTDARWTKKVMKTTTAIKITLMQMPNIKSSENFQHIVLKTSPFK